MPSLTRVFLSSLVVVCAQTALASDPVRDGFFDRTIPLPAFTYDSSDAGLLAERHLALYRASQQLPPSSVASEDTMRTRNDERDVVPISVRTSATAKRPLSSGLPANPSAEN